MAVHIKLIKDNIKSSSSYGKYFAKSVNQGEVTLVVLPGLGRFSLRVKSLGCGFLPAGRRIPGGCIVYDFCEGVKAVWQKGFKP